MKNLNLKEKYLYFVKINKRKNKLHHLLITLLLVASTSILFSNQIIGSSNTQDSNNFVKEESIAVVDASDDIVQLEKDNSEVKIETIKEQKSEEASTKEDAIIETTKTQAYNEVKIENNESDNKEVIRDLNEGNPNNEKVKAILEKEFNSPEELLDELQKLAQ